MVPDSKIRILHLSAGLESGGAEIMLYRLLKAGDRSVFDPVVVSMTDKGTIGPWIEELGITVHCLGMTRGKVEPGRFWPLVGLIRRLKPQVLQTWMYHADLAGGLAARLAGGVPVCWGIHHTSLDPDKNKKSTILTARACALLADMLPARIVCCSESTKRIHVAMGYPVNRMTVVPNGFDLECFAPDKAVRRQVRNELGIPEDTPVVGLVARFDPQKDHRNFVSAAILLVRSLPETNFVLCGDGIDDRNSVLTGWIRDGGLSASFHLLGERSDVPRLLQAFDVTGTSSASEAFPLVVGEAMACGIPCVVTDVGDSALIVGDTGLVVAAGNPEALANAWKILFESGPEQRMKLGVAARKRVLDLYNLPNIVRRYEEMHLSVVG